MTNQINHTIYYELIYMEAVSKRISDFCKIKKIKNIDLINLKCGSSQTVSFVLNGKQKPNSDFLRILCENYKELNARWLLTGEGEMFTDSYNTPTNKQVAYESSFEYSKKNSNEDSEYINTIMLFTTTIDKKDSKIEKLYQELSEKSEEIGSLKEQVKGLSSDADKDEKKGKRVAG